MNPSSVLTTRISSSCRGAARRGTGFRFTKSVSRLSIALIAMLLLAPLASAETLRLLSSYKAVGKNPDGSPYTGAVAVKIISDTTFAIEWRIGDSVTRGFGMRMNDTLSATYLLNGQPGLVMYKVQDDGSLSGIWAIRGQSGNGSETLRP